MCISFSSLTNNNNTTNSSNAINRTSPESISRHVSTDAVQQHQRLSTSSATSIPIDITNPSSTSSLLLQSVPNVTPQQQVILVAVNQHPQRTVSHETNNNNLLPLSLNIPSSTSSLLPTVRSNGQVKTHYENPTTVNIAANNLLIG